MCSFHQNCFHLCDTWAAVESLPWLESGVTWGGASSAVVGQNTCGYALWCFCELPLSFSAAFKAVPVKTFCFLGSRARARLLGTHFAFQTGFCTLSSSKKGRCSECYLSTELAWREEFAVAAGSGSSRMCTELHEDKLGVKETEVSLKMFSLISSCF